MRRIQDSVLRLRKVLVPTAVIALSFTSPELVAGSDVVSHVVARDRQAAAAAHWSREKIAKAPGMVLPVDRGKAPVSVAPDYEDARAAVGSAPAGAPDGDADRVAQMAYWMDWAALEDDGSAYVEADPVQLGSSGVYTYFDVNVKTALWKLTPHKWVGKFTLTMPTGDRSCSATAISGNNIVTAAHCVYDTPSRNQFYTNMAFTPAYRNGAAPYGTFAVTSCSVLTAWKNLSGTYTISTGAKYDVAVCAVRANSAGQGLNQAVGFAGRRWDADYLQLAFTSGYPAQTYTATAISNGPAQYLRACIAETFQYATDTLGVGCYWGAGISGSGWLVDYKPQVDSGANFVNSVVSGGFVGQPNVYGARFTKNNIVVLCNARGC